MSDPVLTGPAVDEWRCKHHPDARPIHQLWGAVCSVPQCCQAVRRYAPHDASRRAHPAHGDRRREAAHREVRDWAKSGGVPRKPS